MSGNRKDGERHDRIAQAEQIRKMRTQGVGYRAIASVVGLSRDIVRNYCRSHGMDGYASALTKNIQEQMMLGKGVFVLWSRIDTTIYR